MGMAEYQKIQLTQFQLMKTMKQVLQRAEGPLATVLNPVLSVRNPYGGLGYIYSHEHAGIIPILPTARQLSFYSASNVTAPVSQPGALPETQLPLLPIAPSATLESSPSEVGPEPPPGCRSIPALKVIGSWVGLYKLMYVGTTREHPLLDLEAKHGTRWRPGANKRWHELRVGWAEILRVSTPSSGFCSPSSLRAKFLKAAQDLDVARAELKAHFPSHLKQTIMPKHTAAKKP
jgi:hypothetical protein